MLQENSINNLLIKCESDTENVPEKVDKCYYALNLPFCEEEIGRVHRIGKEYKDNNSGKKLNALLSCLNCRNLNNSPTMANLEFRRKKTGQNFTISVNLTRRRYNTFYVCWY